jgi:O-antigen/teichoic acid export membrane protein
VLKNISSNWVVIVVTVLVSYVLTPYSINTLGAELYGLWLVIASLTAYLYLIRGGLPAASVRYLAKYVGKGDLAKANRVIASCLWLYVVLTLVVFAVGGLMLALFERAYDVPPAFAHEIRPAFLFALGTVVLTFFHHLPYAAMEAHDEFVLKNRIVMGALALRLVLVLVLLSLRTSIVMLALALLSCALFELLVSYGVVRVRYPGLRFSLGARTRALRRKLFRFGAYLLVLSLGAQLAFQTDAMVIGAFLPFADVSSYSVANSLVLQLISLMTAIAWVVMPRATKLHSSGRADELRAVFLRWSKVAFSIGLAVGSFLLFLGPAFLGWWISPAFEESSGPILQVLVAAFLVYLPVSAVAIPMLMARARVAWPAVAFVVMGVVNVGLSIALIGPLGLMGAAFGTAFPTLVFALVVLRMTCRVVGVSSGEYVRYVFGRPLVGAVPVAVLLAVLRLVADTHTFHGLFLSGLAMLSLFGGVWLSFVYRHDPYLDLVQRLRDRFRRAPQSAL